VTTGTASRDQAQRSMSVGMGYAEDEGGTHRSDRVLSRFAVVAPVVVERDSTRIGEDKGSPSEIDAVLGEILPGFALIPLELHG